MNELIGQVSENKCNHWRFDLLLISGLGLQLAEQEEKLDEADEANRDAQRGLRRINNTLDNLTSGKLITIEAWTKICYFADNIFKRILLKENF